MFIDSVKLTLTSGKGGAGCVAFRREKFVLNGGPEGGDGGRGGDVYLLVDNNTDTLSAYKGKKNLVASNGVPGMIKNMSGKKGEDLVLKVPPGTQVFNADTDEFICDLISVGDKQILLKGGLGGLGNTHFKSAAKQRPTYAQPGLPGETISVRFELKLIADVGLVGFPNVGKSTLISTVSSATPEIANYEFTTLTPKLGVVDIDNYDNFVMADIPGIIEGASDGKGLGLEFLRHIERTKFLLYVIDSTNYRDLKTQFITLQNELQNYSNTLSKREFGIMISKVDSADFEVLNEQLNELFNTLNCKPNNTLKVFEHSCSSFMQDQENSEKLRFILPVSSITKENLDLLINILYKEVKK